MASYITDPQQMSKLLSDAVAGELKDLIKAELMIHAEKIVEDTAVKIANGLKSHVEVMHAPSSQYPDGRLQLHVWVGPADDRRKVSS